MRNATTAAISTSSTDAPADWVNQLEPIPSSLWTTELAAEYDVVDIGGGTYTVTLDTTRDSNGDPRTWTTTFTDIPGFTSTDQFGRARGGSSITLLFSGGSSFVFERQ